MAQESKMRAAAVAIVIVCLFTPACVTTGSSGSRGARGGQMSHSPSRALSTGERVAFVGGGAAVGAGVGALIDDGGLGGVLGGAAVGALLGFAVSEVVEHRRQAFHRESDFLDDEIREARRAVQAREIHNAELAQRVEDNGNRILALRSRKAAGENIARERRSLEESLGRTLADNQRTQEDYQKVINYLTEIVNSQDPALQAEVARQGDLRVELDRLSHQYAILVGNLDAMKAQQSDVASL